jgi:hypothetical protein
MPGLISTEERIASISRSFLRLRTDGPCLTISFAIRSENQSNAAFSSSVLEVVILFSLFSVIHILSHPEM